MNKKYIIIGLSIILVILCGYIAFELMNNNVEYKELVLPSGSTMEMPDDMKLVGNNSGIYVFENDDCAVIIFNSAQASAVDLGAFANDKLEIFGTDYERNTTVTDTHAYGCNLKGDYYAYYISNNETHDSVIVFAKNKDVGDHIIKSIKYTINNDAESSSVEEAVVEEPAAQKNPEPEKDDIEKEQDKYLAKQDIDKNGIIHGGQADGMSVDEFRKVDRDIRKNGMK